jgi:hypothetical protein
MDKAIDRLFKRLAATYGAAWDRSLGESPIGDVKTVWAHELSAYANSLHRIAWALENLPERCPNVIEFKKLCYSAPSPEALKLPEPKADPARLAAELAKLAPLREKLSAPAQRVDYKQWARDLLANPSSGTPATIAMAKRALEAA